MRKLFFIQLIFVFTIPIFVFAHGNTYLEFNPDKSNSLKDADVATPSQVFFAQSDFLNGFDIWVANPGLLGTATFQLLNEQGIVLTTKSATVPTIPLTSSGTQFHVDFNSQMPVLADKKYTIRITSAMPELRLYYSDRVQLVSHNAPSASEYLTGVALLGSDEQLFSFKYALYETNETSAPIISNLSWAVISPTQMKVDFNANEAVDYKIDYGPMGQGYTQSTNFFGDYEFCTQGISNCSLTVQVSPNNSYNYTITVKDAWGNQSQATGTFISGQAQTPAPTSVLTDSPPVITNLRITDVSNNSVSVAWTTNKISNSYLLVVLNGFISVVAKSDPILELEHFLEIESGLSASTPYLARVTSTDLTNNETKASISFLTLSSQPSPTPISTPSASPTTSPQVSSGPTPAATLMPTETPEQSSFPQQSPNQQPGITNLSLDGSTGTVEWQKPDDGEPSDGYRIDIFDKDGNLKKSILVESGNYSAEITGLEEGEEYSVIVYKNDDGVFKKLDKPKQLKQEESFIKQLLEFWWVLIPLLVGLGYIIWRNFKKKTSQVANAVN